MNLFKHIVSLDIFTRNSSMSLVIINWKIPEKFLVPKGSSVIMTVGEIKIAFLKRVEVTDL